MKPVVFNVGGDGLWSSVKGSVEILDMNVLYCNEDKDFGELCVYFNNKHWDVELDGLIYTDKVFLAELREFLTAHGLDGADVEYSEQGMQTEDYVSCDVGKHFIASWEAKFGELAV
jgi:hypothetical protein